MTMCCEQGKLPQPKTRTAYLPLINMTPSLQNTLMMAIAKAQEVMCNGGQGFVLFTCDLQLYKVELDVKWAYPDQFSNVILRLGGMHSLMSFIGDIGKLMAEAGLSKSMCNGFFDG